jgi:8-amino-7-oxononanoate synthase
MRDWAADLRLQHERQLYRHRRTVQRNGVHCREADRDLLAFCSNDYLGLSRHPEVIDAFKRGADTHGIGSGAAHLVNGHCAAHQALEEALADFLGQPRALLFSTGYMANLAVLASLGGRGDSIHADRLSHASLIDGAQLSRARLKRYPHADTDALARALADTGDGEPLVVTDGVFSMDGDIAPLPELLSTCRSHAALLLLDDAHAFGVLGPGGQGTAAHFGLTATDALVQVVTFGKALGTFGAAVAGSELLIESLIQKARPYIYTTAAPPALAEASRVALRLLAADHWRRQKLTELVDRFRRGAAQLGLPLMASVTPIQPVLLGEAARALRWSRLLAARGILVTAIRPPTVPDGASRLRISFSADHSAENVDQLLAALEQIQMLEPN